MSAYDRPKIITAIVRARLEEIEGRDQSTPRLIAATTVMRHGPAPTFVPLVAREPDHTHTVDLADLDPIDHSAARLAIAGLLESFKRARRSDDELAEIKKAIVARIIRLDESEWPIDIATDEPMCNLKLRARQAKSDIEYRQRALSALIEIGREVSP